MIGNFHVFTDCNLTDLFATEVLSFFVGRGRLSKFPGVPFALLNIYLVWFGEGAQHCPPYVEHRRLKKDVIPELFLYR